MAGARTLDFMDSSLESADSVVMDRLPQSAAELRIHLLRRLGLLEREVMALVEMADSDSIAGPLRTLEKMEAELRELLEGAVDSAAWSEQRAEILALWRRHRAAFEELATGCRQEFPARVGQRRKGPRW